MRPKPGETLFRFTIMAERSSWRAPGLHSTPSPRFTTSWLPAFEPKMRRGSMTVRTFACPRFRGRGLLPALALIAISGKQKRFRGRGLLPALALIASLAMTINATAQGPAAQFPRECALKEITVITLIEEH